MLWCVYHAKYPMRVVNKEGFDKHIATGEWFDHPNKVIKECNQEVTHERQIRRRKRKRKLDDEVQTNEISK